MKWLRHPFTQPRRWIILLLLLGIFFRFYHLDYKVYWYDETQTSLRISGHTRQQMQAAEYTGRPIRVADLLRQYQYPNRDRDLEDTLDALAGSPEHAPLYFLSARVWLQTFGRSIGVIRSLSALVSLLAMPALYWLCWELFQSAAVGGWAVLLLTLSPLHVLYAQEARQYSLWTVTILLASAALVRAWRRPTLRAWSLYAVTLAIGLYTHTFTALILAGHGIYVALMRQGRQWGFALAAIAGIGLFWPWLQVIIGRFSLFAENTASVNVARADLQQIWGLNLSRLFFDVNQGPSWINPVPYLLLALVVTAFCYLYRTAPLRASLFVITLAGVSGLALLAPDVILGGRRSSITRYAIPSFLAIEVAVAYLLAGRLAETSQPPTRARQAWQWIAGALLVSGILSCAVSSQVPVWWHKSHSKSLHNPAVARVINRAEQPVVVSDQNPGTMLALAHLLDEEVRLQLVDRTRVPEVATGDRFVYRPSDELRWGLERAGWRLEPAARGWLWRLQRSGAP